MMSGKLASARQSQLVTTYGVGALFPAQNQSFMIMGLEHWSERSPEIAEPRLARVLGVTSFRTPAAGATNNKDVPVIRFPEWHFCPSCRRLGAIRDFCGWDRHECQDCDIELVPSRFVICCPRGHIDEFPYFSWVHAKTSVSGGDHKLSLSARGRSSSLADIIVSCSCDVQPVSMEGAFESGALAGLAKCQGRRPWLGRGSREVCNETPRTLQRGSSNVWFPKTASAISIPPWSEGAYRLLDRYWRALEAVPPDVLPGMIEAMNIAGAGYSVSALVDAVQRRLGYTGGTEAGSVEGLKAEEYKALSAGRPETERRQDFVCTHEVVPDSLQAWLTQVGRVSRLREVRALTSFSRILPPLLGSDQDVAAPLSLTPSTWLPAMEVIGEGVFLRLDGDVVNRWAESSFAQRRADIIQKSLDQAALDKGLAQQPVVTPRQLLLHTLAHALIDQLSLDAGYPAASLRERLYATEEMAGILIYTATSDSAGSLGGLAAMSATDRLDHAVLSALDRMSWCSSDPVCIEANVSGMDGLNIAACHSCVLLPETCCEVNNTFLDRATLVGTPQDPEGGFFSEHRTSL